MTSMPPFVLSNDSLTIAFGCCFFKNNQLKNTNLLQKGALYNEIPQSQK